MTVIIDGEKFNIETQYKDIEDKLTKDKIKIKNIKIKDNIISLSSYKFDSFYNLEVLDLYDSNIKILSDYVCANCPKLTTVSLPNDLKSINDGAFFNCDNLYRIVLPKTVNYIGKSAFENCKKLEIIEFKNNNNFIIDDNAFRDCTSLQHISLPRNLNMVNIGKDIFKGCDNLKVIGISQYSYESCFKRNIENNNCIIKNLGINSFDKWINKYKNRILELNDSMFYSKLGFTNDFYFKRAFENSDIILYSSNIKSIGYKL